MTKLNNLYFEVSVKRHIYIMSLLQEQILALITQVKEFTVPLTEHVQQIVLSVAL